MPKPKNGEKKQEFISRCMAHDDMQKYKQDQRAAICYSYWNEENEEEQVSEKAESKSQQHLMGMVYAYKKGELNLGDVNKGLADKIKKISKSMSKSEAKKFASTNTKDLPKHVKERNTTFKDFLLQETK